MEDQQVADAFIYLLGVLPRIDYSEDGLIKNYNDIKSRLERVGVTIDIAATIFDHFYEDLSAIKGWQPTILRVFTPLERVRLAPPLRNLLLNLECRQLLDIQTREVVIAQLMQTKEQVVTLDELKFVVLLMFINRFNNAYRNR